MNFVILQGRPVRDPELRTSKKNGKVFCVMRIAVPGPYRGRDLPKRTNFFNVYAFGNDRAQYIYNNVGKGAYITIQGKLENYERVDNTGRRIVENDITLTAINIHEWTRNRNPLEALNSNEDAELLIPREITNNLYKQIEVDDEDIPDDISGGLTNDTFQV